MRLCRFRANNRDQVGFYDDKFIVPLTAAAEAYAKATNEKQSLPESDNLLDFLPPDGKGFQEAQHIAAWLAKNGSTRPVAAQLALEAAELLVPIPRPNKLLLLAGNYNDHIQEGGGAAANRLKAQLRVTTTIHAIALPLEASKRCALRQIRVIASWSVSRARSRSRIRRTHMAKRTGADLS
jgi:hypothetical protein